MSLWSDLIGTTLTYFRLGRTGPRLKDDSGTLAVRDAGDTAAAPLSTSRLDLTGLSVTLDSDGTPLTLTLPAAKSTDGYVLAQKAGTAADVLELELISAGSTASTVKADTTTLAFGSASPVSMFQLPVGGVIHAIEVIIDTAFDGTPTASVGISGNTSKYAATSRIDLTASATTVFQIHPGQPAPGSPEDLEIAYSAGGATAGSARFLVYYSVPA